MLHEHGHDEPEDLIDLEEWAKAGKTPKPAKTYRIRIDKDKKDVNVPSMTGRQILALVNKTPETHMLSQKIHGAAPKTIGPRPSRGSVMALLQTERQWAADDNV